MTELEGKYLYDIEKTTVECCTWKFAKGQGRGSWEG